MSGEFEGVRQRGWRLVAKRSVDCVVASIGLFVLGPLIAVVAAGVRRALGSPVLFRQVRPGLNGAPFTMVKFRTMTDARDDRGELLPDAERTPAFGRFLRSSTLDELPELWNVVRGEMSLVGPRPLLMEYLPRYSSDQSRRHAVLPGMTGWAQVNGRNLATWEQRLAMDVWYADNWSLGLDLRILLRTPALVLKRAGISHPGHATMPRFDDRQSR